MDRVTHYVCKPKTGCCCNKTVLRGSPVRFTFSEEKMAWDVCVLSRVQFFATPLTIDLQAPLPLGFSRQEYWNGLPFPSLGDLPNLGIEHASPTWQEDSFPPSHLRSPLKRYWSLHFSPLNHFLWMSKVLICHRTLKQPYDPHGKKLGLTANSQHWLCSLVKGPSRKWPFQS